MVSVSIGTDVVELADTIGYGTDGVTDGEMTEVVPDSIGEGVEDGVVTGEGVEDGETTADVVPF